MIYVNSQPLNGISYIDNQNHCWASDENYVPSGYEWYGKLNAVYYKNVLVWGEKNWAYTRLNHFAFGSLGSGYNYVYVRESVENMPSSGTIVKVSNEGFPMYISPEPVWPEDMTPENMEYPRAISYTIYLYNDVSDIVLNENSSNMFRNTYATHYYNGNDGIVEYLNFRFANDVSRMFEHCRYLGWYSQTDPEGNNVPQRYKTVNNLVQRLVSLSDYAVTNMFRTFYECAYLRGTAGTPNGCINLSHAYFNCGNLNGRLYIGNLVKDASYAFYNCYNMINSQYYIGTNTENLDYTFYRTRIDENIYNAHNMQGIVAIPDSVKTMSHAFQNAFCGYVAMSGNSVYDLSFAYASSHVRTVAGSWDNAKNMDYCFANLQADGAYPMFGDLWLNYKQVNALSPSVSAVNMLQGRPMNSRQSRFNIHVRPQSFWNAWFWQHANELLGNTLTWTLNQGGEYYHNDLYNIYVYYADTYKPGGVNLKKFSVNDNTQINNMVSVYYDRTVDADINVDA